MAITGTVNSLGILDQRVLTTTNATTLVTVPASTVYNKIKLTLSNTSATLNAVVDIYLVPSGGTAGVSNCIYPQVLVTLNTYAEAEIPHDLTAGYFVAVKSDTANIITAQLSANSLT